MAKSCVLALEFINVDHPPPKKITGVIETQNCNIYPYICLNQAEKNKDNISWKHNGEA